MTTASQDYEKPTCFRLVSIVQRMLTNEVLEALGKAVNGVAS